MYYKKRSRNFFKYLFVIVVVAMLLGSVYTVYYQQNRESEELVGSSGNAINEDIAIVENLKMAIYEYDNINPLLTNNKEILNLDKLIFEPLINVTSEYYTEFCLAKSCEKKSDTQYEIILDTEAQWHDGSSFTSRDVIFTIQKLGEINSIYSPNISNYASMEAIDSSTLIINLKEADIFFEYTLDFPVLPSGYYEEEDFVNSTKIPIGTGMYKIASNTENSIFLTKNTRWAERHGKEQRTESITIQKFSSIGEAYNAFKMGSVDVINTSMTNYEEYIGTLGYNKKAYAGRNYEYISFNCADAITGDQSVRRAIAYAINKDTLNTSVFYGNKIVSNGFLDYGSFLYNGDGVITYNTEQARQELLNGGWTDSGGTWQKDGKKLSITLVVNNNNSDRVNVANNIKSQLNEVGIKVNISSVSSERYWQIKNGKTYQMMLCGVTNSTAPKLSTFYGSDNEANYDGGDDIKNDLTSVENIREIQKRSNEAVPYIGLYRNKLTLLLNANVGGNLRPTAYFPYYNFEYWFRQQ